MSKIAYTLELTREEAVFLCLLRGSSGNVPVELEDIVDALDKADRGLKTAQMKLWHAQGCPRVDLSDLCWSCES